MSKITLSTVSELQAFPSAAANINSNSATLTTAMDNTLSRDGTSPNTMNASLDMNSQAIINLPAPVSGSSPLRLTDASVLNGGGTIATLPAGGTTGQALKKASNANFDFTYGNDISSVDVTFPAGITVVGGPITSSGTIAGSWTTTPTGTGANVFGTSPTIATPTVTNPTVSAGTYTSPTLITPALGTPTSGVLTSCTGLPIATGVSGLGTNVGTFLVTPSSANLLAAVTDETGTGVVVFGTSPTITKPNIIGTVTNDNAAAGSVGELIEATLASGSATALTTAVDKDIITISLTAGDWDVTASAYFIPTATTSVTNWTASLSTVANTVDVTPGRWIRWAGAAQVDAGAFHKSIALAAYRFSLSGTTTVRLVGSASFTASTLTAYGYIRARRIR